MEKLELLTGYKGYLSQKLLATDVTLPLSRHDNDNLMSKLTEGNYTYLTISDSRYYEVVKVTNICGSFVLERGVDGTTARTFPCNALVQFEMVPSVVRYMICNEDCVECDCSPVVFEGSILPPIKEGEEWTGSVIFSGDTPMTLGVSGAPSWMKIVAGANYLKLSGVPKSNADVTISVGASNCGGELETIALTLKSL